VDRPHGDGVVTDAVPAASAAPRVGVDALALRVGGGLTWLHRLVPALVDAWPSASFEVLARPEGAAGLAPRERLSVEARDVPRGMRRVPHEWVVVPRWARERRLDVVLVGADAGPTSMPCPFVQVCQNAKVYAGRGLRPFLLRRAARATARRAFASVFVSRALAALATPVLSPRRTEVVPHGVAPPSPGPFPRPIEGPYVLVVATPYAHKDLPTALEAVLALRRRGRRERLVLAGAGGDPGVLDDLARRARGDAAAFVPVGRVEPAALDAWLAHAAALMLPSREESSGMPVAEAVAAGVAVVASDLPALVETAAGRAAHHAPGDVVGATELLARALDETPAERARRVEAGRAFAAARSWEACARGYRDVLVSATVRP
jgi:glycosyltransferase involved in cell wall biosynthesis